MGLIAKNMKHLLIVFGIMLCCCIPLFAKHNGIPLMKTFQYKAEMERIIDEEFPNAIKAIDNDVKSAKNLHDKMMQTGFNFNDYMNLVLISEVCVPAADLDLYAKLMQVTQEKYLGIKYEPIGTDSSIPIMDYLDPYLRDNRVNTEKLDEIAVYENKQIAVIEKYIKEVEKLQPDSD